MNLPKSEEEHRKQIEAAHFDGQQCSGHGISYEASKAYYEQTYFNGSQQVRELLKQGKPVIAGVSSDSQEQADKKKNIRAVKSVTPSGEYFYTGSDTLNYKYASPCPPSMFAWPEEKK